MGFWRATGAMTVDGTMNTNAVDAPSGGGAGGVSGTGGIPGVGGVTSTGGALGAGGVTGSGGVVDVSTVSASGRTVDVIDPSPTTDMSRASGTGEMVNFYSVASALTLWGFEMYITGSSSDMGCVVFESDTQDSAGYQRIRSFQPAAGDVSGYVNCSQAIALKAGYFYAIGVFTMGQTETYYYHSTPAAFPIATTFGALISAASYNTTLTSFPWSRSTTLYYSQILVTSP